MTTHPQPAAEPRSWLLTLAIGLGILLGFAAMRWLPQRRRKSKIDRLREQAEQLTERITELA